LRSKVSLISRVRAGPVLAPRLLPAVFAAAACFALSACSPGADYPTIFPAIHDMPPPRAETPLDADQVQQATEDLIAERNRMNGGPQASGQAKTAVGPAANLANPQPKKQPPVQPAVQTTASTNAGGAPADSAETK
jgi:hypothetical protein